MDIRIAYKDRMKAFDIDDLKALQGDLKELSDEASFKLTREIEETGFAFPIHAWIDQNSTPWIIGGHQRLTVLKRMRAAGKTIPKIPVVIVEAKSLKEAKRRVLQDVAQYGIVTFEGLRNFSEKSLGLDFVNEHFDIPGVDLSKLFEGQKEITGAIEINEADINSTLVHTCPKCGFSFGAPK